MSEELMLMIVYEKENEDKAKAEMFVADRFDKLYKIRDEYKQRKDIKCMYYKIFQKIEEKDF